MKWVELKDQIMEADMVLAIRDYGGGGGGGTKLPKEQLLSAIQILLDQGYTDYVPLSESKHDLPYYVDLDKVDGQ